MTQGESHVKKVLVPVAPGFEEIEAVTVIDVLRRAGAQVTVAGTCDGPITASRGVKILPDVLLDKELDKDYDMIVIPGGILGVENLRKDPRIIKLSKRQVEAKRFLAAICAGPMVLEEAQILQGRRATCHPVAEDFLKSALIVKSRVVVDRLIITSQAAGTAMEFAFKLVELLYGHEKVDEINKSMLAIRE